MHEMKNEMKNEMSTVKELVLNMSKEMAKVTRGMGEVKDQLGKLNRDPVAAVKKESHRSKQEPKSDARSLGASFACFQPSINTREDIINHCWRVFFAFAETVAVVS